MRLKGKAIKLGDDINTDFIISGRYKFHITDIKELAKHIMEDIDPDFGAKITFGSSVIVAGENFGMGSSREQAPLVIKESGIICVLAKSFARIFYRNSFNIGLPLVETDTDKIDESDLLDIDLAAGEIVNLSKGSNLKAKSLPKFMEDFIDEGGVLKYLAKNGELKL